MTTECQGAIDAAHYASYLEWKFWFSIIAIVIGQTLAILAVLRPSKLNRTCSSCGRQREDRGSHFACPQCEPRAQVRP